MFVAQPVEVEARPGYKIWVKYADGPEGEVDLSDLVGQGPYAAWTNPDFFKDVHIDSQIAVITWGKDVDVCPDAVYLELTGMPFGQVFPWMQEPPVIGWMLEESEVSASTVPKLVEVKAREGYRIWLRFDDGVSGEVDLSDLAEKGGVFKAWEDRKFFESVYLDMDFGAVMWSEELDLCGDALYLDITGMSPEDLFPMLRENPTNARTMPL